MEHSGDHWLGYDRRFRMTVAGNPLVNWASIDTTLWNLAFSAKGKSSWCKHCFSLSHSSNDCEWGPEQSTPTSGANRPTELAAIVGITLGGQAASVLTAAMSIFVIFVHLTLVFQIKDIRLSTVDTNNTRGRQEVGEKLQLKKNRIGLC